jgi:hypothetical protein
MHAGLHMGGTASWIPQQSAVLDSFWAQAEFFGGQVVAADLQTEGGKDVVAYKVRVDDASGSWTVSRRFRNFETLHRALRENPAYRLRLPAKRIFSQQHSVEFVEDRRSQLDAYLQSLLANPAVAGAILRLNKLGSV